MSFNIEDAVHEPFPKIRIVGIGEVACSRTSR
jgi:hypothetical protein